MGNHEPELKAFYDRQAPERDRRVPDPRREAARQEFIGALIAARRHTVLEIGCGTGADGLAFKAAGIRYTGIDLSEQNVRLARAKHLEAVVGSVRELPFASGTFSAGWTMSTLLHVPNQDLPDVLAETTRVLVGGAPLAVGLWSGNDEEGIVVDDDFAPYRFYSRRTDDTVRRLFGEHGLVSGFTTWDRPDLGRHYQFFILTKP
jgi:SAM-dependent methyltransferase